MDWTFAAILFGALVLTGLTSLWQTRRYVRDINQMAHEFNGAGRQLVSGRARGRMRGAVVALVVDPAGNQVLAAKAMTGASILARLAPAPQLVGDLDGVAERASNATVRKALEDALTRVRAPKAAAQPML